MKKTLIIFIIALLAFGFTAKAEKEALTAKPKTPATPQQLAKDLLRLANRTSNGQLRQADRDKLSEQLESLSAYIVKEYNTGALCSTDIECEKLAR